MYDQNDCIFCFDEILDDEIIQINKPLLNSTLNNYDIRNFYTEITNFIHQSVTLTCNHTFHIGCFTKYIRYNNTITHVTCPICRSSMQTIDIIKIVHIFKNYFKETLKYIKICLTRVSIRKNIERFKLNFSRKNIREYDDVLEYHNELYFLYEKIKISNLELDNLFS